MMVLISINGEAFEWRTLSLNDVVTDRRLFDVMGYGRNDAPYLCKTQRHHGDTIVADKLQLLLSVIEDIDGSIATDVVAFWPTCAQCHELIKSGVGVGSVNVLDDLAAPTFEAGPADSVDRDSVDVEEIQAVAGPVRTEASLSEVRRVRRRFRG